MGGKLYINLTNRCTNRCTFCVRNNTDGFGYDLWLETEPTVADVVAEIGTADPYEEVVFCGFGEPTERLPELLEIAEYLKTLNKKVRLNTNGLADRRWNRPVALELAGRIDAVSISLNAGDKTTYQERCQSAFGESAFDSVVAFAASCVPVIPEVTLSVVDILPENERKRCAEIAHEIGADFRVRTLI